MPKLAIHFQTIPAWAPGVVTPDRFAWAKVIDPGASNPFPGVRAIGRLWLGGDDVDQSYVDRCEQGAEDYFRRCLPRYCQAPWVHCWEAANEPRPFWDGLERLDRFSRRWVEMMHGEGLRAVVGSLSVGQPAIDERKPVAEQSDIRVLADALEIADYWSLHEYAAGTMRYGEGWFCLRYRRHVATLQAAGVRVPPLFITECGVDGGAVLPEDGHLRRGYAGWLAYGLSEDAYLDQLAWYDGEIERDGYVQCATVFTAGPTPDWELFRVTDGLARRIGEINARPREGLPEEETATDPATLAEKVRWWLEEEQRTREAGRTERADAIRKSLIKLLYRLEQILKGA